MMLAGFKKVQGQPACKRAIGQRTVVLGNWLLGSEGGEAMGMVSMDKSTLDTKSIKVSIHLFDKGSALMMILQRGMSAS